MDGENVFYLIIMQMQIKTTAKYNQPIKMGGKTGNLDNMK
jgi:hypothetical protein